MNKTRIPGIVGSASQGACDRLAREAALGLVPARGVVNSSELHGAMDAGCSGWRPISQSGTASLPESHLTIANEAGKLQPDSVSGDPAPILQEIDAG